MRMRLYVQAVGLIRGSVSSPVFKALEKRMSVT